MSEAHAETTRLLADLAGGDAAAAEKLLPLVYGELRDMAQNIFRRQRPDHTLQPTALVHEAFVKMVDQTHAQWADRTHFMAVAATAMRQILIDHARRTRAAKRGGDRDRVVLDDAAAPAGAGGIDLVALDDALTQLAQLDARRYRVVELRFFGGLSVDEVAEVLGVSKTTVESDWRSTRAWLNAQLAKE
jgi:RNA polymerase sigma factor (TIGR02999 family)